VLRGLDVLRLRNLGLLIVPAVVLPLAGLGIGALGAQPPGGNRVGVAHATRGPAKLEPTPFDVKPFKVELPIPPEARPVRVEGNTEFFEVDIEERDVHIPGLPDGLKTTIWGFEGQFPGPTFEALRGRHHVVRLVIGLRKEVGE